MEKLSLSSYVWKCVLAGEALYFLCLAWGTLPISESARALHRVIFEVLPGFSWESSFSYALGAVYVLVGSSVFGYYMVWMHNSSLISVRK
jgi:hypothetical protein